MLFFNISLYPFIRLSSCASHISKTPSEEQSRQNKNLCLIQQSVAAFRKEYLPAKASPVSLGAVWQAELPVPLCWAQHRNHSWDFTCWTAAAQNQLPENTAFNTGFSLTRYKIGKDSSDTFLPKWGVLQSFVSYCPLLVPEGLAGPQQ